jgi:hypothetical protein
MWIVFRDPKSPFLHLDKYVFALVEDKDIFQYREELVHRVGGRTYDFDPDVFFLQQFVTSKDEVEFFARRFTPWVTTQ